MEWNADAPEDRKLSDGSQGQRLISYTELCAKHNRFLNGRLVTLEWSAVQVTVTCVHLKLILTFGVELNGVTVRLAEAPRTVEDGSALFNVDLPRFGLGSSDHHTGAADRAKKSEEL